MIFSRLVLNVILAVVLAMMFSGCDKSAAKPAPLPGDDVVLARVNGAVITKRDVESTMEKQSGIPKDARIAAFKRDQTLRSLVARKAMATAMEKEMSPMELAGLEKETAVQRETVLVIKYIDKHAEPKPVSQADIEAFYDSNRRRFGEVREKTFEIIGSKRSISPRQRKKWMTLMEKPEQKKNWEAWAAELNKKGLDVEYQKTDLKQTKLHPKLRKVIGDTALGATTKLLFIENSAYVIRIIDENVRPAKPIKEVENGIREMLESMAMEQAVKALLETAVKKATIEYVK